MVSIVRDERISVSEMIREYDNSNTGRIYTSAILKFFEFIYPELKDEIQAKKRELDARYIPPEVKMEILDKFSLRYIDSDRDLRDDLLSFKKNIETQAPKSRKLKLSVINQFLKANGIDIPSSFSKRLFNFTESGAISDEDIPTNDDLKRICEYLPVHGKALALVLASSGMRVGEAVQLMDDDLDLDHDPYKIKLRASITKTGRKRLTFISPEAKEKLDEWLTFRDQYLKQASGRSAKYNREGKYEGLLFPFTAGNFNAMWVNALSKVGLLKKDPRTGRVSMSPHKLRKFYRLRLGKYGRDEAEALMGHQQGMHRVYARFIGKEGEQRLSEVYKKAIADLSIYGRSIIDQRMDKAMREQRDQLQLLVNGLVAENVELKQRMQSQGAKIEEQGTKLEAVETAVAKLRNLVENP